MMDNKPLFAFYGDDFTGSTDALEWLCRAGLKSVLFLEPPTTAQLKMHQGLQAFGIAGATRSLNPEAMQAALAPTFKSLKESGVRYVHYKVCSTFDSSPTTGSIGKAIEVGASIFTNRFAPIIQSAPVLGRYLFFGNLFARMGIGSNGEVFRLDRHPSMMHHPATPTDESDLRLHLAKQTKKQIGLVPILDIIKGEEEIKNSIDKNIANGASVIFFDALENQHLAMIAAVLKDEGAQGEPLFLVGSSGVEIAFAAHFKERFHLREPEWQKLENKTPLLVVCGSCSPVTTKQIQYALENGFKEVIIDVSKLAGEDAFPEMERVLQKSLVVLREMTALIVHSKGDERMVTTENTAEDLGRTLGEIAKRLIQQQSIKRIVVAGGDTSSYAARALGIQAVEMIAPLAPGAPLCKVTAADEDINGLQICFKGGQVGDEGFFKQAAE
jgi:uncharacterized protein YgbK (DUF1537 family)